MLLVDPEATGHAIAGLLVDPDRRAAMDRVLRERVKRHYDQTTVIDRYRQLYLPASATGYGMVHGPVSAASW